MSDRDDLTHQSPRSDTERGAEVFGMPPGHSGTSAANANDAGEAETDRVDTDRTETDRAEAEGRHQGGANGSAPSSDLSALAPFTAAHDGVGPGAVRPYLALEARNLYKRFGSTVAVEDFTLSVPAGAIFGLIGPNGAGKTTSMRMLATLLEPDGGDAWIGGASIQTHQGEVRRQLGYMPDFFGVYPELKVAEYLDFYAACHGVPAERRATVANDLLGLVDLTHKRDSYVAGLSRGMQQRLGLARALVHDPSVLLLDEPASGLDPRARLELREVVRELGRMGKAVLVSSHILAELADLCTHIAIVDGGRVLAAGPVDEVTSRLQGGRSVRVQVLGKDAGIKLRGALLNRPGVHAVTLDTGESAGSARDGSTGGARLTGGAPEPVATARFVLDGDERALRDLLAALVAADLPIFSFGQDTGGLEDVFLQVTRRLGEAYDPPATGETPHGR